MKQQSLLRKSLDRYSFIEIENNPLKLQHRVTIRPKFNRRSSEKISSKQTNNNRPYYQEKNTQNTKNHCLRQASLTPKDQLENIIKPSYNQAQGLSQKILLKSPLEKIGQQIKALKLFIYQQVYQNLSQIDKKYREENKKCTDSLNSIITKILSENQQLKQQILSLNKNKQSSQKNESQKHQSQKSQRLKQEQEGQIQQNKLELKISEQVKNQVTTSSIFLRDQLQTIDQISDDDSQLALSSFRWNSLHTNQSESDKNLQYLGKQMSKNMALKDQSPIRSLLENIENHNRLKESQKIQDYFGNIYLKEKNTLNSHHQNNLQLNTKNSITEALQILKKHSKIETQHLQQTKRSLLLQNQQNTKPISQIISNPIYKIKQNLRFSQKYQTEIISKNKIKQNIREQSQLSISFSRQKQTAALVEHFISKNTISTIYKESQNNGKQQSKHIVQKTNKIKQVISKSSSQKLNDHKFKSRNKQNIPVFFQKY